MLKRQFFGVEVEMTGLTREKAAWTIADRWATQAYFSGGAYQTWTVNDRRGRPWKFVYDGSIHVEARRGRPAEPVELVTPKLEYEDLEEFQQVIRALRKAGARVNESCGVHVHVDASNHTPQTLRNLVNIMASKEDLLFEALRVDGNREARFCRKVNPRVIDQVNRRRRPTTMQQMAALWYGGDATATWARTQHYHDSRYTALNLHSVFFRGTVEFRLFNGTLHAGELKGYVQLCLAISAQALTQRTASPRRTTTTNKRYTFRTWLLRLGLIGDEFKTCRLHLLKNLTGNAAWRHPAARQA